MTKHKAQPIFIMSSERSGSNLLRTLLGNHSNIAASTVPQFLPVFHKLAPYYAPLSTRENALHLMEDMLALANHPYLGWDLALDLEAAYRQHQPRLFLDFFTLFYEAKQIQEGKQKFVCKENIIFDFAFHILHYYEQPQFLYLYRDPRDYAASFMKVPTGPKTVYRAANLWKHEQEQCSILIHAFGLPVHYVQYEALIADPAAIMRDVLLFLEEPVEEACFDTKAKDDPAITKNVAWRNLAKPVIKTNRGKYRAQFSASQVKVIESVTRDQMIELGYEFDTQADWRKPPLYGFWDALLHRFRQSRSRSIHQETYQTIASRSNLIKAIEKRRRDAWIRRLARSSQRS